jgi:glyoxylase-like metal-dependent hydrolase (beta-lactamase superfamily II)
MELKITDVRQNPGDSAFLIDDGKTAILYDSGFGFTGFGVADKIKEQIGDRNLDFIFLTHSHYDHALGSAYVLEIWPDAKVVAGEYAAKIFSKDSAKAVMRDLDRKFAKKCGVESYPDFADNLRVDIPASDGDVIKAGDMEFEVINLPGHTKCSVGFYNRKEKLLLGCESIGVYDGEGTVVPSYLVGVEMAIDSIEKAEKLEIENILVPHFGLLGKEDTKIYFANARKSARETADEIIALLKEGKTKEDAIEYFKKKFYSGYIKEVYPKDAMELNTGITVDLIKREYNL